MRLYLASDHAGFDLKQKIALLLHADGHEVIDYGDAAPDPSDDYPDFVIPLARKVVGESGSFGIVIGGSGQGEAMAANRLKGARAVVFYGDGADVVSRSRKDNDANILSIGARFVSEDEAMEAVRVFLAEPFSGEERHIRRIKMLDQ